MRPGRRLMILIAAACLCADAQVTAASGKWPGVQISFAARLEPPPGPGSDPGVVAQLHQDVPGGVIVDEGVHRVWKDAEQKAYLGYDVTVAPGSTPGTFQVKILPLSLTPQQMARRGYPETWTRLALPKYPVIPDVRRGDTIAIDLMVNPANGKKIVDYLTLVSTKEPVRRPRDFSAAEGELLLSDPRVIVNGKVVEATAAVRAAIKGPAVWLYWQGGGRFIFSLVPDSLSRLQLLGDIIGNVMTIRDGPDTVRIECNQPIGPGGGPYYIYGLHDRAWQPPTQRTDEPYILGSAPLGALLKNR